MYFFDTPDLALQSAGVVVRARRVAQKALAAFVQALSGLELEVGFAAPTLMHAQEVLAENRFLAARDGPAAALIDPVRARLVPVSNVVAELVTAAMPHALALGAADELASVSSPVASPEASRVVQTSGVSMSWWPSSTGWRPGLAARFLAPERRARRDPGPNLATDRHTTERSG